MGRALVLLVAPLVLFSCAGVPRLGPLPVDARGPLVKECRAPFLAKGWRLIHSVSGSFPGGGGTTMIGVTEAKPSAGRLHCVLMSVEGLVLCDATHDGTLRVARGLGPFSSPGMVMGMVRDIRLMLFAPAGAAEPGLVAGRRTCRYRSGESVTDVSPRQDGSVEVVMYEGDRRARRVRFSRVRGDGLPGRIELEAAGAVRYRLLMDLIEADPVR